MRAPHVGCRYQVLGLGVALRNYKRWKAFVRAAEAAEKERSLANTKGDLT